MPRHLEAMKDVASCEKLRVGASSPRSEDFRMGQPINSDLSEGKRRELKHLSTCRNRKQ